MATFEEVQTQVAEMSATIAATDAKLDEVRAFIQALQAGGAPVTQEQLDQLSAMLGAAKSGAEAVLAETDALDG